MRGKCSAEQSQLSEGKQCTGSSLWLTKLLFEESNLCSFPLQTNVSSLQCLSFPGHTRDVQHFYPINPPIAGWHALIHSSNYVLPPVVLVFVFFSAVFLCYWQLGGIRKGSSDRLSTKNRQRGLWRNSSQCCLFRHTLEAFNAVTVSHSVFDISTVFGSRSKNRARKLEEVADISRNVDSFLSNELSSNEIGSVRPFMVCRIPVSPVYLCSFFYLPLCLHRSLFSNAHFSIGRIRKSYERVRVMWCYQIGC